MQINITPAILFFTVLLPLTAARKGSEIGKVFQTNGRAVEITGEKARQLKAGTRILIETSTGLLEATIKEQFHTKAKTMVSNYQATKIKAGAKVYLLGKEQKKPDNPTERLIILCNAALANAPTESDFQGWIDKGANVNFRDEDGYTPLLMAASRNRAVVVKVLIQNGADINARIPRDESNALIEGARNPEIISLLLERGADAAYANKDMETALLIYAGTKGGFKPHTQDNKHTQSHIKITDLLLQHGADINAANKHGETVLMKAAAEGNPYYVKYLVEKGADINLKNKKGETVLEMLERQIATNTNYQGLGNWKKVAEMLREMAAKK